MSEADRKSIEEVTFAEEIQSYIVDPATGEKIDCKYKDPTQEEQNKLGDLQEQAENGDEDAAEEFEELVIDELFLSDKITSKSPMALKQAVIAGLFRALGDNTAVQDAQELVSDRLDQGNR